MAQVRRKRPRDPIQLAKLIGDIATGQAEDRVDEPNTVICARKGGLKGGKARAVALTPKQRSEIARVAAPDDKEKEDAAHDDFSQSVGVAKDDELAAQSPEPAPI